MAKEQNIEDHSTAQKKSFISQENTYIRPIFVGVTKNDFSFDFENEN